MPPALLNRRRDVGATGMRAKRNGHARKGQIQMAESIGAIVIVTMIIFFGILFYTKLQRQGIAETVQTSQALSAIELSQRVAQLPELSCSSASVTDSSCIDLHKALAFASTLNPPAPDKPDPTMLLYYSYLFGNARIELQPIYASDDATIEFLKIGYPASGIAPAGLPNPPLLLYENKPAGTRANIPVRVPFHIQNSLDHENYLGVLIITTYGGTT